MRSQGFLHVQRLLTRLQTFSKTDIRYLLKGTALLSIGQIFATLSAFLLTVGLARVLDQAEYGQYAYILSLAGVVGMFTHSGMDTAVAQSIAKGFDRSLLLGFWSKLKWSTPVAIITLCAGGYYLFKDNEVLGYSLLVTGLTTPLLAGSSLYGAYFNGKKQFKKIAYDNALKNIAISASILLTAFITHSVLYVVCAYFLSSTLISAARFYLLTKKVPTARDNDALALSSLVTGKHFSLMELFGNISMYVDKIIVFQLLGATSLAFYSLALAPTKQLQSVSRIMRALALPKFSTRSIRELKSAMRHKIVMFFIGSLFLTILYCILAQFFFIAIFPQYTEALLYSQVLSLTLLFMPSILHVQALTSLNQKKALYVVNIVKSVTKISFMVILIPLFGIWGAIASFLLTQVATSCSVYYYFQKIKEE